MTEQMLGGEAGVYRRGMVLEVDLPTREDKILALFRSTPVYVRAKKRKRAEILIAAHFWADNDHRGFW